SLEPNTTRRNFTGGKLEPAWATQQDPQLQIIIISQTWWHMLIIPAAQEAEAGRSQVQGQPQQLREAPSNLHQKIHTYIIL
uniref:Uncharacterized protein n=1 Tax=Urocitellus parryii TaxID=9999 RepID=A0A8D2I4A2_UROPR